MLNGSRLLAEDVDENFLQKSFMAKDLDGAAHHKPEDKTYREQPKSAETAAAFFLGKLGCEQDPTDKFIWDTGNRIQKGEFTLEEFIAAIDAAFEKDYKFKGQRWNFGLFKWNPELTIDENQDPQKADDWHMLMEDRDEVKLHLRKLLQPFEEEKNKLQTARPIPLSFRLSFETYSADMAALENWKKKFPKKIAAQCERKVTPMANYSANYIASAHAERLSDEHNPPLDILAERTLTSLLCEREYQNAPLWYVGERLARGDFSFEHWKAAFKKEVDKYTEYSLFAYEKEIDHEDAPKIIDKVNDFLSSFESNPVPTIPLASAPLLTTSPYVKDYLALGKKERSLHDLILSRQTNEKKFPCDNNKGIDRASFRDKTSAFFDHPDESVNVCYQEYKDLESTFQSRFELLQEELETAFLMATPHFPNNSNNPNLLNDKMKMVDKLISDGKLFLTGEMVSDAPLLAEKTVSDNSFLTRRLVERRVPEIIIKNHIDEFVKFWTETFTLGRLDPNSDKGIAALNDFSTKLNSTSVRKMILDCLESDGRVYLTTAHEQESSHSYRVTPEKGVNDLDAVLALIAERKKEQNSNPTEHHFSRQTNWAGGQTSFDLTEVVPKKGDPDDVYEAFRIGKNYYRNIQKILDAPDKIGKKPVSIQDSVALNNIIDSCELKMFLKKSKDKPEVVAADLLTRMKRSYNGYRYSNRSWIGDEVKKEIKDQALEDFAIIQQFCLPLHLDLALDVYLYRRKAIGSLKDTMMKNKNGKLVIDPSRDRKTVCSPLGDISNPRSAALTKLNTFMKTALLAKQNAKNAVSPLELEKLQKQYNELHASKESMNKEIAFFDEVVKKDKQMKLYLDFVKGASIEEEWKFMGLFTIDPKKELGLDKDLEKAADIRRGIFRGYVNSTPDNFKLAKNNFLEMQKNRIEAAQANIKKWIVQQSEKHEQAFKGAKISDVTRSFDELSDRAAALAQLFNDFESSLADQMRNCLSRDKSIDHIPTPHYNMLQKAVPYTPPAPQELKKDPPKVLQKPVVKKVQSSKSSKSSRPKSKSKR